MSNLLKIENLIYRLEEKLDKLAKLVKEIEQEVKGSNEQINDRAYNNDVTNGCHREKKQEI